MKRILVVAAVSLLACGKDVTAPGEGSTAAFYLLSPVGGTNFTATVGALLDDRPAVIVRSNAGAPVPGVPVLFTVMGEGSVADRTTYDAQLDNSYSSLTVDTDADGIARPLWLIGKRAGRNVVFAQTEGSNGLVFVTLGLAGSAETIEKIGGDAQLVPGGTALLVKPSVAVLDRYSNPVPGVAVTFTVTSGGGSVIGSQPLTDSSGRATIGEWVVGTAGAQTLSANVPDLPAVTFSALIDWSPACGTLVALPPATAMQLSLDDSSCTRADGRRFGEFEIDVAFGAWRIIATSTDFDTEITLSRGHPIAFNDDFGNGSNSQISALLPAGRYTLRIVSRLPGTTGHYTIEYFAAGEEAAGCEPLFVTRGTVSNQESAAQDDCSGPQGGYDTFLIYLEKDIPFDVHVETLSYSAHNLEMRDGASAIVATGVYAGGYAYLLSFIPPANGFYGLNVGSSDDGAQYKLTLR